MTDGINHVGVGMTMTRINADGDVEAIKDRKVEKRVEMLISGDLTALIAKRDELKRQADAMKAQLEADSTVFQGRKHYRTGNYVVKNPTMRGLYEMVAAYDRTIAKLTGV